MLLLSDYVYREVPMVSDGFWEVNGIAGGVWKREIRLWISLELGVACTGRMHVVLGTIDGGLH